MWMETKKLFIHRLIAKLFDFVLVFWLVESFDAWILSIVGLAYVLFADGLFSGQSLGKRIMGLRVAKTHPETLLAVDCDFYHSAVRNFSFALIIFLSWVPFIGWLFALFGLAFIAVEVYFMFTDDDGIRIGDIYAKTTVVAAPPASIGDAQ